MKILIVNTLDVQGGAARAAYRLHQALLAESVDSAMLVQSKSSDDYTVIGPNTKIKKTLSKLRPSLDSLPLFRYKNRSKTLFSLNWLPFSDVVDRINDINPDVVHLHWVNAGMMRTEDLIRIKAPIVWSLHDMWPFTDGYHYDPKFDINDYGLSSEPRLHHQAKVFSRKNKAYRKIKNITVVGLSKWLHDCSKNSSLLGDKVHVNLPNPIDTKAYSPFNKGHARDLFNLPSNKKLVLFGAMGATSDPRKGFKELADSLSLLNTHVELVVFGSRKPERPPNFKQKVHYLGELNDDVSLRILYSAADVMVVPSLQENLSNAIMESLSCATPAVGFDIGGNGDLIEHQKTGYLAKPFDTADLAKGIEWVLNAKNYEEVCQNARDKVLCEFDSQVVAKKYIGLYKSILDPGKKA
ncbi:glycosyltransferase family 4 protein [Marinomonas shanghaiensis]|uniref:glycosyltransferase family 4 protein n=1 Tax=Marinomonas shanghaiensis TaxID=2202418 RepID=UPI000DB9E068|nr:glycosyltransferase family 4 protein [Marinomonas shanghaiensis]